MLQSVRLIFGLLGVLLVWHANAAMFSSPSVDPTVGLLPAYNDAYPNWKNAGLVVVGGIPTRSTVCATVNPTGITPPAANDDATTISNAIASCTAGQVVQLGSGTFQLDFQQRISLNKGVTLRGTGSCTNGSSPYCSTVLNVRNGALQTYQAGGQCGVDTSHLVSCSAGDPVILVSPSGLFNWGWAGCFLGTTPTGCGTKIAVDTTQGQTTVQVASTTNFSVGTWVLLDEDPVTVTTADPAGQAGNVQASSDFQSTSGAPATLRLAGGDLPCTYSFCNNRLNEEIHLVKAIGAGPCPGVACTLTFDDPLVLSFRQSGGHGAQVYWPTVQGATSNPFLQQAGVENLTITRASNSAITMTFCAYCWVKNVEVGGWIGGAVNLDFTARNQVEFNYFHDCWDCENNGVEYPVGINSASTEAYLANNIIVRGGKGMVGRGANTAVVAYNYVDDTFYQATVIGDYWVDMGVNGSHYAGTHDFLFEGNWGDNCDNDNTHGNAIYHTYFRNWCTALRTPFTDPSNSGAVNDATGTGFATGVGATAPGPLRAAGPMAWDYWMAYIGNVLGTSGTTTAGNGWTYQGSFATNKNIWMLGWNTGAGNSDPNLNGVSHSFIFRHGNYDYVNAAVQWDAGTPDHTLPKSFYLLSKPPFFTSSYPWPWVAPTSGTQLQSGPSGCGGTCSGLPAKARFDAGTPFVQP